MAEPIYLRSYFFLSLMNGAPWGGSEELWFKTAQYLAKTGATVSCAVYTWNQKEQRLKQLESCGCTVYRLPNKRTVEGTFLLRFWRKQKAKVLLKKMISELRFTDYDVVVVNQGGLEILTRPWKNLYQQMGRYTLLFHNYSVRDKFSAAQKNHFKAWTNHARQNLFAAEKAKDVLHQQMGTPIPAAGVFLNPISFTPPLAPLPYPPLQNEQFVFSVFAALDVKRKAQDKLLTLLSAQQWKRRPWILNLYGEGADRQYLQNEILRLGLQAKVFLKGHTGDVAAAMRQSHLVLQLTKVDAMPLSVVEAMAIGRPLVVSSVGDMPHWVEHHVNGWVCEADENSMRVCLEDVWQQRNRWEEMGKASFARWQQFYPASPEACFTNQLA